MVISASLNYYRVNEFIQFIRNTLMIVSQHGADNTSLKNQYSALNRACQQLEKAYKKDANPSTTPQLAQLDAQRDQTLICLRKISEGYSRHYDATLREAATCILGCIDKYGSRLYQLNYSAETAALKNIARDLQTDPACIRAIQTLSLRAVVQEMMRSNLAFEALFVQRLKDLSEAGSKKSRQRVRVTTEAYRTLIKHLQAHATLAPSEQHTSLISHLNENIDHFNQIVERRKAGSEAETPEIGSGLVPRVPAA